MNLSFTDENLIDVFNLIDKNSNENLNFSNQRQPIHTLYGGANLFKSDSIIKMSNLALKSFKDYAPNFVSFAKALNFEGYKDFNYSNEQIEFLSNDLNNNIEKYKNENLYFAFVVYQKVLEKLKKEAVEDFRIDFEDGFGNRPSEEEDHFAIFTAQQLAKGIEEKTISPFIGIRIKPLTKELKKRSIRTLDLFISTLLNITNNKLPDNFVVTLPKVTQVYQVEALVRVFELLESKYLLPYNTLKMEIMIESTEAIFDSNGINKLPLLFKASNGRCRGIHFGAYDYTASCDVISNHQKMSHQACNFIRDFMKVSLAHTECWLSDGATNIMPIGKFRYKNLDELTLEQLNENIKVVHQAWKISYDNIQNSLINGYYQGWDLHPAQIPVRYASTYMFFLKGFDNAHTRLKNFIEKLAQATLVGDVFDDAATGQGLLNFFLRASSCGAINNKDIIDTGLSLEEIETRSFFKILKMRNKI